VLVYYPADLPVPAGRYSALVGPILEGQPTRHGTKHGPYNKRLVSGIYNAPVPLAVRRAVKDLNSVKAYRREIMDVVPMRPDWHRFMVVVAACAGISPGGAPVPVHPRRAGTSKFGIGRIPSACSI